jgi:peptide/nickel transport system substrate-binding protein
MHGDAYTERNKNALPRRHPAFTDNAVSPATFGEIVCEGSNTRYGSEGLVFFTRLTREEDRMVNAFFHRFLCLSLLTAFVLPSSLASAAPKSGGTLTLAIKRRMNLMNPMVNTGSTEHNIRTLMFEPLLGMDLKGNIEPRLAESWKISDDGKEYVFQLRKGVKFHDGREMTSADIKFAIEYSMNPKNGAYGFRQLADVASVEATSKYVLTIRLKRPSTPFLGALTSIQTFSVVPKGSLEEGVSKPSTFPPGTGPFKFVKWEPRQRIVFERFDDYWGEKAFVDSVVLRPIQDATVRFTALRTGEVDMVEISPYEWVRKVLRGEVSGIKAVPASHASFRRVTFNVAAPPFDDRKVRLAVAHAIDRQQALEAAYLGFGAATEQVYPQGHLWFVEEVKAKPYDPARAKTLLREAGYKGEPVELMISSGVYNEAVGVAVQSQLKKVGLNVKLNMVERGTGLALRRSGKFAFRTGGGSVNADPYDAYIDFQCEQDSSKRIRNESGYCNPEVDSWLEKLRTEQKQEKRKILLRQIVSRLQSDVPQVNLGFAPEFFSMRNYVKGFQTDLNGMFVWQGGGLQRAWLDK